MLLNSFRDGSRSRHVVFQLPNYYYILLFLNLDIFWCNLYRFKFYLLAEVHSLNKENLQNVMESIPLSDVSTRGCCYFVKLLPRKMQMQQMSLFNSIALRQIRNHVIDDDNYIWDLS